MWWNIRKKAYPHPIDRGKHHEVALVLPNGVCVGGTTTWVLNMASKLVRAHVSVALLEHLVTGSSPPLPVPPGVRHFTINGQCPDRVKEVSEISCYVDSYSKVLPAAFVPNYGAGCYAACASISMKQPQSLRVIGYARSDQPYYYDLIQYYEPIIQDFVGVSSEITEKLKELMPHRKQDMFTRSSAVDVPPRLHRTYSPEDRPLQLIYAGRIVEAHKRVSRLISLSAMLYRKGVNFHLKLVGDIDPGCEQDKDKLVKKIQTYNTDLRNRIELIGRMDYDRMHTIWESGDICVLTSEYEGTSNSMLEAMAYGCVPVVTQVSGTSAVIQNGRNGYAIKQENLGEMAQIIQNLDLNRNQLRELGLNAHATITSRFSYDEYIDWFLAVVKEVWGRSPRAWPADRPILPSQA